VADLGSLLADHGKIFQFQALLVGLQVCLGGLMVKGRDIVNLAPSSPSYHLGLKQGLIGLAGLGSQ
jgi:hypothetical protein